MKKLLGIGLLGLSAFAFGITPSNASSAVEEGGCVGVTFSCGVQRTVCGESTLDIIDSALELDDVFCE